MRKNTRSVFFDWIFLVIKCQELFLYMSDSLKITFLTMITRLVGGTLINLYALRTSIYLILHFYIKGTNNNTNPIFLRRLTDIKS